MQGSIIDTPGGFHMTTNYERASGIIVIDSVTIASSSFKIFFFHHANSIIKFKHLFTWFQLWQVLYGSVLIDIIQLFTGYFPDNVAILPSTTYFLVYLSDKRFAHVHVYTVRLFQMGIIQ